MPRLVTAVALALFVSSAGFTLGQENNLPPDGFAALFNGRDLSGWHGMGHFDPRQLAAMSEEDRAAKRAADLADMQQHWTVQDGEIVNDGDGVYLTTDRDFGDFELWIDYKTVPKADSGIYLRANPQVQIWDFTEEGGKWNIGADKGSGGLWNNSPGAPGKDPLVLADKPFGQWNRLRVRQVGARTSVWLNDRMVVNHAMMENFWDRGAPLFRSGPIQLQTHGGEIRWRNVFVREIPTDEANRILALANNSGFASIFNGKDFSGWAGPTENYEVKDGVLMCQPDKGGTIYTNEEYGDFVARLEFKLPPGGNNGLAIRYPGSGDTAYGGMCELQVLDSEHPKYAQLDTRQYHGSAYGMVAAHRGYLRPTGEWNYQEVTVKGSTIKVELNGTVILDADLAGVSETMGGQPHPGKDRTSGHFGFAGHSDPVEFRNISIKRLDAAGSVSSGQQRAERVEIQVPIAMDYQLFLPEGYDDKESWPLIVFLHGAGERGDDVELVKVHGPPKIAQAKNLPFLVVAPQCKRSRWWEPVSLDGFLDEIVRRYKVDQDRIYLTGLSMGGFGTWAWAGYAPDRFAAIAPICGGGDPIVAYRIGKLPTWVFHGAKDSVVPLQRSEEMVEALKKREGDVKFTVYPEAGHDSWTESYDNPELYEWFLQHKRGSSSAQVRNAAPNAKDVTGRWNITILETGDTFQTAWLKLDEKDGGLNGALVWKWGSVVPISDGTLGENGIRFRRGKEAYQAALVDGGLRGVATMENGDKFDFVGSRASEMCDVTGTWKVHLADDPDGTPGTFVLQGHEGEITGKGYDPQGHVYAVRDAKLDGYALSFSAAPVEYDAPAREVRCAIRGDVLVGDVTIPLDNSEKRTVAIEGERQREWGEPVHLLQQSSLDGWGPRDSSKKFGWKVEHGVLENQPPDVDIMSEAKFRDFRLHLEYKVNPGSNSGVYLRGRYELQILGSTRVEDHGNMAVYSRLKPNKNPLKPGEWNDLDVTFIGRWLTVVLNGETVHDNEYLEGSTGGAWDSHEEQPGPLLLQGDHGKVWFRNIVVTPVK